MYDVKTDLAGYLRCLSQWPLTKPSPKTLCSFILTSMQNYFLDYFFLFISPVSSYCYVKSHIIILSTNFHLTPHTHTHSYSQNPKFCFFCLLIYIQRCIFFCSAAVCWKLVWALETNLVTSKCHFFFYKKYLTQRLVL